MAIFLVYILFSLFTNIIPIKAEDDKKFLNEGNNPQNTSIDNISYYIIRNHLSQIKSNPEMIKNILLNKTLVLELEDVLEQYDIQFFIPVINELFLNESNSFINDTYDLLKINQSGVFALDYIIELGDYLNATSDVDINEIFYILQKFLNFPGTDYLLDTFLTYNDTLFYFFESLINNTDGARLFGMFRNTFWQYRELLISFGYNLILVYNDINELVEIANQFTNVNKYTFWLSLVYSINQDVFEEIKNLLSFENKVVEAIKNQFLLPFLSPSTLYSFLEHKETFIVIFNLIKRYKKLLI